MKLEHLSEVLKSLCEDRVCARTLLGSAAFLEICAALAEGFNEHFRLITLMEKASNDPAGMKDPLGSKLSLDIRRALESDQDAIRLLQKISRYGSDFCEELNTGNRSNQSEVRHDPLGTDWRTRSELNLIVAGQREAREAAKDIKKWLKGCEKVTICDPYLVHYSVPKHGKVTLFPSSDEYVDFVSDLIPASARQLKLFGCGYTKKIKTSLGRKLKVGRTLEFFDTTLIHDRYVIKDNIDSRMIGTSFGGFV